MQVTSAAQSRARDEAAIAAGEDSFTLMLRAGTAATEVIVREAAHLLASGVDIHVGPGNNGGDGYVVAAQLARLGVRVRVHAVAPPATPDAARAEQLARRVLSNAAFLAGADEVRGVRPVQVDALLGTGAHGPLRETVRSSTDAIARAAGEARAIAGRRGAMVIALDMPTGVNASSGEAVDGHVRADITVMFGTCKAGSLVARDACGSILVVDIGLGPHATLDDAAPQLADPQTLRSLLPAVAWNAHKGVRGRVLLTGGTHGMAGAMHLAAAGALASGAGLVRACVHEQSVVALQSAAPGVVCMPWPHDGGADAFANAVGDWAHIVAIGPGLGRDQRAHALLDHTLELASSSDVALVLDADAITVLAAEGISDAFRRCAKSRPVVLTPHDGEFASLARAIGIDAGGRDPEARLLATRALAGALSCTVLRKGTPTLVVSGDGAAWSVPRGSAALATGGTGDVLTGVLCAVFAHDHAPERATSGASASALAAWVHGVAGEALPARGSTVQDVIHSLPRAWTTLQDESVLSPHVLCVLPALR